jgi:hypothetical protein
MSSRLTKNQTNDAGSAGTHPMHPLRPHQMPSRYAGKQPSAGICTLSTITQHFETSPSFSPPLSSRNCSTPSQPILNALGVDPLASAFQLWSRSHEPDQRSYILRVQVNTHPLENDYTEADLICPLTSPQNSVMTAPAGARGRLSQAKS